ncbi:hypothetical protein Taro_006329 [Colocasia esculenta]|uniref:Uncharacterized protein n=1 Tax=Colocasia esculenta TaxID=4460 RepID=A0A843TWS0_COLES|nr:hypothetical protein [Colocasia esculenta]
MLPLLGGLRLHGCRVLRVGQSALRRRWSPRSRSGRDGGGEFAGGFWAIRHSGVVFGVFSPRGLRAERGKRLEFVFFAKGELLRGSSERFEVLEARGACSRREDVMWSGGNTEGSPVFAFFMKCGTVEVCIVFLDTLTPVFELYVWLRERWQVLRPESLEVPGMDLQLCVCRGVRRVLNATALVVAFLLPLLSGRCLHARQVSCAGRPADVGLVKVTVTQGELLWGSSERFEVLEACGSCSRREDVVWSGGNAEGSPIFAFFMKCGTVEVCVVFLDTLTPVFELYVRLRERRQWDSDFRELVFCRLVLRPESLEVPDMDLQLCSRFDPFEVCPGVGTVVTAVVACGVPEWWHSFGYG